MAAHTRAIGSSSTLAKAHGKPGTARHGHVVLMLGVPEGEKLFWTGWR